MGKNKGRSSWVAFGLFYLTLVFIITLLDGVNDVLRPSYWGAQVSMMTIGVGLLAIIGTRQPDLSTGRGVFLTFTIGILTIVPAVLMGLGQIPGLWPQYFYIAFGMSAGSFLTFLFLRFFPQMNNKDEPELERDHIE